MSLTTFYSNSHKDKREKEAKKAAVFNKASRSPWFCESYLTLSFTCLCWQGSSLMCCVLLGSCSREGYCHILQVHAGRLCSFHIGNRDKPHLDALMLSENIIPCSRTLRMESCKRRLRGAASPQVYTRKDATGLAVSYCPCWPG